MDNWKYVAIYIVVRVLPLITAVTTRGIVSLDDLTFYKVLCHHTVCVVKFDKKYAYGAQENEFQKFALRVASNKDVLIAELSTTDWGEKENHATRQKFNISTTKYPVLWMFFKDNLDTDIIYDGEFKEERLVKWLKKHSNLFIGSGTPLEVFEELAKELIKLILIKQDIQDGCNVIIKKAEDELKSVQDENNKNLAGLFLKIMTKICNKGAVYISAETIRVKKLLKEKMLEEKRGKLEAKVKVLKMFKNILAHVTTIH